MITIFFIIGAKYLIIVVAVIAGLFFLKQPGSIQNQILILSIIALPAIYLTAKIGGWLYYDPRPFVQGNFLPLIPHTPDNGFPSDHVLLGAAIACVLYPFSRTVSLTLLMLTGIIGISRVYVGVHHSIDIMGSALIAAVVTIIVYQFIKSTYVYRRSS